MNKFHSQRLLLGGKLEEEIIQFLEKLNLLVINTSFLKMTLQQNINVDYWNTDKAKKITPLVMLRWLPDLLVIDKEQDKGIFIDIKLMYTPIYFDTLTKQIEETLGEPIEFQDIGNIEREAYDSYENWTKTGAKVATLILSTYSKEFILCDYVNKLEVLYRDERERNYSSSGSTTPRVNIHLGKLNGLKSFLEDFFGYDLKEKEFIDLSKKLQEDFNFIGVPRIVNRKKAEEVRDKIQKIINREIVLFDI